MEARQQTSVIQTQKSLSSERIRARRPLKNNVRRINTLEKRFKFYSQLNPHFKVVTNAFISIYNFVVAETDKFLNAFYSQWSVRVILPWYSVVPPPGPIRRPPFFFIMEDDRRSPNMLQALLPKQATFPSAKCQGSKISNQHRKLK